MCGIAGFSLTPGATVDRAALAAMSARIAHRGPDGAGDFFAEEVGIALAHRRLAIVDLSPASAQPMVDERTGSVLVYNGEIYNFRELRAELEALGHGFRSRGDVEVLLTAFVEWGDAAFERLCGMFALALWDRPRRRLLLARDALGMKPLYWTRLAHGEGLAFASEVKAFLALPGFVPRPREDGLAQYFEFGYVFDRDETILEGVFKLPPATVLELRDGAPVRSFTHFTPPRPETGDRRGLDERAEELLGELRTVVGQHLIADVPIGLLLSGGIDSGIVAALAARAGGLRTVAMGFARSSLDERDEARRTAQAIGSRHEEILIEPAEIAAEIETTAAVMDDLFADWGAISTRLLYRRCRELGLKVALVGEGADELFGGYPVFERATGRYSHWGAFQLYRRYAGRRYGALFGRFRAVLAELTAASGGELFDGVRRFETTRQLPNNYVMKVDKASMSVSLEARAPFLDRRIATLALSTPRELLLAEGTNKLLLRRAAEIGGLLPPELARRPKRGGAIAANWLEDDPGFRSFARGIVLDRAGWCDRVGLRRPMESYFAGKAQGDPFPRPLSLFGGLAWRLLLLNLWSRAYLPAGAP